MITAYIHIILFYRLLEGLRVQEENVKVSFERGNNGFIIYPITFSLFRQPAGEKTTPDDPISILLGRLCEVIIEFL